MNENLTGVENAAAAGQDTLQDTLTSGVEAGAAAPAAAAAAAGPQTGVEPPAAAGPETTVDERAFAARLAKERDRIAQETRDALIAELYGQSHGIKTYEDYKKAAENYRRQAELEKLVRQNIPREYAEKLVKVDELENWQKQQETERQRMQEEQAKRERNTQMFTEFLNEFPEYASEEKWKTIPKEVFAEAKKWIDSNGVEGRRLSDAFSRHIYNLTVKQQQKEQANQLNAGSSTGSVKGIGTPDVGFISKEAFEQNKNDQNWMMKNYDALVKSMHKWK